jgi:transcriptional regulator with XRE-family HTH domain
MTPNKKFKDLRKSLALSQIEFAAKIGVSQGTIADIERGRIGISKRVKEKIIEKMNIEAGYFDNENQLDNIDKKQGDEAGGKQGMEKIGRMKMFNGIPIYPSDYWTEENFHLRNNFEKKLLLDVIHNHKKVNDLLTDLNTLGSFEFIIENLHHYYFNSIILQFHSASKYRTNGKFNYDLFKEDYLKEVEKLEAIRPALNKISKAIDTFYNEIKEFDSRKVIEGYFGE